MLIEYKNATIRQDDGSVVLDHVDFHVDEGEFIYITGRVGSGKSTLLKTLYFELTLDAADCATVFGHDIRRLKRRDVPALRRQMGIIFQDFQLLGDRNVHDNLLFVLKATGWKDKQEMEKRICDVLKDVEMADKADRMPHELSGGEQQRIAIARAILNTPKVIIADEPTGNLDPETASNIVRLLRTIAQTGTSVVMTTHNIPLLKEFPGIVYRCGDHHLESVTDDYNKIMMVAADSNNGEATYDSGYEVREDLSV